MYAKIENNVVVHWPISNIQQLFPNTSFPLPITAADLPAGYVAVGVSAPPSVAGNQKVVPGAPIQAGDSWVQSWNVLPMDAEEIAQRHAVMAIEIRMERDRLLAETDWVVTKAYETQTEVPQAWSEYRQQLRDLPTQPNFPHGTVWPAKP